MKILHIITRLIQGGAQQNTVMSCAAQATAGHEVTLAYGPIFGPEGTLLPEAQNTDANLIELAPLVRPIAPLQGLRAYRQLRRLIRDIEPDVVHTHSTKAGILGRAAAWAEGVPAVVHTVHGLAFHENQARWKYRFYVACEKWAARRCHHLIAITPAMVDAFVGEAIADASDFTVIPSGLDLSCFKVPRFEGRFVRDEYNIPRDAPVLGIVARFDPLKGHADLLRAFTTLRRHLPELRLMFIGDGWHRDAVEQQARDLGVDDRLIMTGYVEHEQIPRLLTAVDVKALPSYQEGQSRTLAEALLCGCAIVAYDVGGIGSICIDNETGRLIPLGDVDALTHAILHLFQHPDQRRALIKRGQAHVRENFDADKMTCQIEQLYRRLLDETR